MQVSTKPKTIRHLNYHKVVPKNIELYVRK